VKVITHSKECIRPGIGEISPERGASKNKFWLDESHLSINVVYTLNCLDQNSKSEKFLLGGSLYEQSPFHFFVYTMIVNQALYDRVKARVMRNNPVHSAYRSGLIVKEYKRQGGRYSGPHPRATGLARWFRENWKSNTGRYGYTAKSSVYRPTKRITKKTPVTFSELTPRELVRAKREKAAKGRVSTFLRGSTGHWQNKKRTAWASCLRKTFNYWDLRSQKYLPEVYEKTITVPALPKITKPREPLMDLFVAQRLDHRWNSSPRDFRLVNVTVSATKWRASEARWATCDNNLKSIQLSGTEGPCNLPVPIKVTWSTDSSGSAVKATINWNVMG
jgi:hypothetical protein